MNELTKESMVLTLDYAYYHLLFCTLQFSILLASGRTKNFRIAHSFGLFALVMDYGLGFLTNGTRTLSYPSYTGNLDGGFEPMGPVGNFLFFVWFDYSAFGIVVWALHLEEVLLHAFKRGASAACAALFNDPFSLVQLAVLPLQFWSAPWLSPFLRFDPRELALSRSSPKATYLAALPLFCAALRWGPSQFGTEQLASMLLSGFGCGLVHHAALFAFGLRGYSHPAQLALTLFSEWPALIAGLACFRHLGPYGLEFLWGPVGSAAAKAATNKPATTRSGAASSRASLGESRDSRSALAKPLEQQTPRKNQQRVVCRGSILFDGAMWACLLAALGPRLASVTEDDAAAYLIPYVPGKHMQSLGTLYLRTRTCPLSPTVLQRTSRKSTPPLDCWDTSGGGGGGSAMVPPGGGEDGRNSSLAVNDGGKDFLVFASAAKAGAVLSARVVAEVGFACGVCVASGERSSAGIPGPVEELPTYDGRLLHAIINMRNWPDYAAQQGFGTGSGGPAADPRVRCVTTIRDPLTRLRSLYLYARSGGEAWFRYQSGLMQALRDAPTLPASLELFWLKFGRAYLEQSHEYTHDLNMRRFGCVPVRMEAFKQDFNGTLATVLRTWGVREGVIGELAARVALKSDAGSKSEEQRRADPHLTANKFSKGFVRSVVEGLEAMPEVAAMVQLHRRELGYLPAEGYC